MTKQIEVLKHTINILAAVLFGAVAFVFIAYGLAYKSLPFIYEHFSLLVILTAVFSALMIGAYIVFYLMKKQSLYRLILCALIFVDICGIVFFYDKCYGNNNENQQYSGFA